MSIRRELIDELLKDYPNPQDVLAEDGLLKQLTKAVIERCLETELDTHLGYPKHERHGNASGNARNGTSQKTVKGEQGQIEVPRDRQGTFEPHLVKKGQTRLEGFDEKILAMYARGMTTRDIQAQLQELYIVGLGQANWLTGESDPHWLIQVGHLALGLGAFALVEIGGSRAQMALALVE